MIRANCWFGFCWFFFYQEPVMASREEHVSKLDKVPIKFLLLWTADLGHYTLKLNYCHCYITKQ